MFEIASDFTYEILDLERKADVHDVDPLELFHHGLDVHADRLVMPARDFKKSSPYLSKPNNNNFLGFSHVPDILKSPSASAALGGNTSFQPRSTEMAE